MYPDCIPIEIQFKNNEFFDDLSYFLMGFWSHENNSVNIELIDDSVYTDTIIIYINEVKVSTYYVYGRKHPGELFHLPMTLRVYNGFARPNIIRDPHVYFQKIIEFVDKWGGAI